MIKESISPHPPHPMASKKTVPKKKKPAKKRLPPLPPIMNDEESVEFRRRTAAEEKAAVKPVDLVDDFRGVYEVGSTQWDEPYIVEIRDLSGRLNSCGCMDFQMNQLGTCKHIERVFQFITHRRKRAFRAAAEADPPAVEIFVDTTQSPPRLRRLFPDAAGPKVRKALDPFFDAEGIAVGPLPEAAGAVEAALDGLSARLRARVRLSRHIAPWAERERLREDRRRLLNRFEADVAAGKRSDNPVNLPLYDYQKVGMRHLAFKGRALLADEMGLGKTVQAIAAAELLRGLGRVRRVLVVSPASLKGEWADQLEIFTGKQARPVFGPRHARLEQYAAPHEYLLCNYEQIRVDVDEINARYAPDLVVLDEAQRIKNWPTKTAKTIKRLAAPHAFVLTGTPLENRVQELYSLCEFIDPHLFGTLDRFNREFMRATGDGGTLEPRDLPGLHRRVSEVMLRRRKADIKDDLPEREEKHYHVEMTDEQRLRYADYEYQVSVMLNRIQGRKPTKEEGERLQLLLACMRMICDTPYILDEDCRDCPKLEELTEILEEALEDSTAKVVVFSEWVRMLELVKAHVAAKKIGFVEHTGQIPQKKRREHIRTFKEDPACRVMLSSESGGVGLNLQNANTVVNLDLPWNPAKLEQRIARVWRKHQKRTVRVVHLVAADSIEEAMIGKLAHKAALADAVLDGADLAPDPDAKRETFVQRVRAVMGAEETPDDAPADAPRRSAEKRAKKSESSRPPASLTDSLLGRHGDRVRGIEQAGNGVSVVIADPGPGLRDLGETARQASTRPTCVISTETLAALRELQRLGLVNVTADLSTLHASEGTQSIKAPPPADTLPLRYPEPRARPLAEGRRRAQGRQSPGRPRHGRTIPPPPPRRRRSRARGALASLHRRKRRDRPGGPRPRRRRPPVPGHGRLPHRRHPRCPRRTPPLRMRRPRDHRLTTNPWPTRPLRFPRTVACWWARRSRCC